jgi:hypothetical protein
MLSLYGNDGIGSSRNEQNSKLVEQNERIILLLESQF